MSCSTLHCLQWFLMLLSVNLLLHCAHQEFSEFLSVSHIPFPWSARPGALRHSLWQYRLVRGFFSSVNFLGPRDGMPKLFPLLLLFSQCRKWLSLLLTSLRHSFLSPVSLSRLLGSIPASLIMSVVSFFSVPVVLFQSWEPA